MIDIGAFAGQIFVIVLLGLAFLLLLLLKLLL